MSQSWENSVWDGGANRAEFIEPSDRARGRIRGAWKFIIQSNLAKPIPASIYCSKSINTNTRTMCEICSKFTIKTHGRRRFGVFIINFEQILLIVRLLTLNK